MNNEYKDTDHDGGQDDSPAETIATAILKKKKNKKRRKIENLIAELTENVTTPDGYKITWRGVSSEYANGRITDCPLWVSHQVCDPALA